MNREEREVEKLLQEEMDKQAAEILSELEKDESLKDITLPEDFDKKMKMKFLKFEEEKEAYSQLSKEDKEALRIGREIQLQRENDKESTDKKTVPFKKKKKKIYLIVAVAAILLMGLGTTAIGENPFVTFIRDSKIKEENITHISNERNGQETEGSVKYTEADVYKEIEDGFGFAPIKIDERPEEMFFVEGYVSKELGEACLLYQCGEESVEYRIIANYNSKATGYIVPDKVKDENILCVDDVPIDIKECKISKNNKREYVAQFEYKNVHYVINTTLSKNNLEEILKKIKFF